MKINKKWIDKYNPCGWEEDTESVGWWKTKGCPSDPFKILDELIAESQLSWANWFIVRLMNHKQKIMYAIYAAEQVIDLYEKKYPDDKRPRQAIEAAKKYLNESTDENKKAAADAAHAAYAAYAAAHAADAATYATYAAYAAYAAAQAAAHVAADEMRKNILIFGISLLKERK
jgi:hypothetical protein